MSDQVFSLSFQVSGAPSTVFCVYAYLNAKREVSQFPQDHHCNECQGGVKFCKNVGT